MYLSRTRKFCLVKLTGHCGTGPCPERCTGQTHTQDNAPATAERREQVPSLQWQRVTSLGSYLGMLGTQQDTLFSVPRLGQTQLHPHALSSLSSLNSLNSLSSLSSLSSSRDALWAATHKVSWSELLSGILPLASAGLTPVILAPNHMLVTAIIWVREKKKPEYKLEWIQASCDCVLFIVCFIDFSTDTLYLPQIFCKYHQQHNLSLPRWGWKNFSYVDGTFNCLAFGS